MSKLQLYRNGGFCPHAWPIPLPTPTYKILSGIKLTYIPQKHIGLYVTVSPAVSRGVQYMYFT